MNFYEKRAEVTSKEDPSHLIPANSALHDFLVEPIRSPAPGVAIIVGL